MQKCQGCGEEKISVRSRARNGKGFYFCTECYRKILKDPSSPSHSTLKSNEAVQEEKRRRRNKEVAEWEAEQKRTARTCTRCGAKHHNNATLCTSCFKKEFNL